ARTLGYRLAAMGPAFRLVRVPVAGTGTPPPPPPGPPGPPGRAAPPPPPPPPPDRPGRRVLADRAPAFVPRAGRGPLPAERVAGVQPPQAPVVTNPRCLVADEHRFPLPGLPRPHGGAVTPVVVDERDAEGGVLVGAGPGQQGPADPAERGHQPFRGGRLGRAHGN